MRRGPNRAREPGPVTLFTVPSLRQFLLLALLWAGLAWGTTVLWSMRAENTELAEAITRFYTLRAPVVGALAGVVWAPLLCRGYVSGHAATLVGRLPGLAVESRTRRIFRVLQGGIIGQMVGASATVLLLVIWPNDMQNTRWDAFKWAGLIWKVYWFLFVPAGAVAGMLSVAIAQAARLRRRKS